MIAVGRLVSAKGQLDLVEAVAGCCRRARRARGGPDRDDRRIGSDLHRELHAPDRRAGARRGGAHRARPARRRVAERYPRPTCSYRPLGTRASACRSSRRSSSAVVFATDAGALPETVGPCGELVAVGDVDALTVALQAALDAGPLGTDEASARHEHLRTFSNDAFRCACWARSTRCLPRGRLPPPSRSRDDHRTGHRRDGRRGRRGSVGPAVGRRTTPSGPPGAWWQRRWCPSSPCGSRCWSGSWRSSPAS